MRRVVWLLPLALAGCVMTRSDAQKFTFSRQQFTLLGRAISHPETKWIVAPEMEEPILVGSSGGLLYGPPYTVISKVPLGPALNQGETARPATEADQ